MAHYLKPRQDMLLGADHNLDPPEDPPECPECGYPLGMDFNNVEGRDEDCAQCRAETCDFDPWPEESFTEPIMRRQL